MTEKNIDGETYKFYLFEAEQATDELTGLLDLFGLSIGKLASMVSMEGDGGLKDFLDSDSKNYDMSKLGDAFAIFCGRIHEKKISQTIKRFMEQVVHVHAPNNGSGSGKVSQCFGDHFKGRLLHMFKVFIAAVEVQYSDFFGVLGGAQGFAGRVLTTLGKQTSKDGSGSS